MKILYIYNIILKNFKNIFFGDVILNKNSINLTLKSVKYLERFIFFLKKSSFIKASYIIDMFGVDLLGCSLNFRFLIYYLFSSRIFGFNVVLKIYLKIYELGYSVVEVFPGALWLEREIFDMFGIMFINNRDLRKILTDYGFDGYPLRKDFPLMGFFELNYSIDQRVVVSNPLRINQNLRLYHFYNVWDYKNKKENIYEIEKK